MDLETLIFDDSNKIETNNFMLSFAFLETFDNRNLITTLIERLQFNKNMRFWFSSCFFLGWYPSIYIEVFMALFFSFPMIGSSIYRAHSYQLQVLSPGSFLPNFLTQSYHLCFPRCKVNHWSLGSKLFSFVLQIAYLI